MKRLLVLLIVFAMTSAASAATVDILVNGAPWMGDDVAPSDIVTLLLNDSARAGLLVGALNTSSIDVSQADNASHTFFQAPSIGGWDITPGGAGYTSSGAGTWFGVTLPQDGIVFVHEFHVPDNALPSDEIFVDLAVAYQFVDESGTGRVVMHVIPEPATIALLGLGALSLLRRRK
jgi:hypothetical protein